MVQKEVLDKVDSAALAVYVVWEPILRTDDEPSSRKATSLVPDSRVTHYWVGSLEVGKAFQAPIDLETEPAWDVYLVYPPGVTWESSSPPRPELFMHQLGGRLPADRRLDGPQLADAIQRLVQR